MGSGGDSQLTQLFFLFIWRIKLIFLPLCCDR
nr:MAG TPA: hypothetical protein [Herelleviridae sp.]